MGKVISMVGRKPAEQPKQHESEWVRIIRKRLRAKNNPRAYSDDWDRRIANIRLVRGA
jgi:hypothetical protein